MSDLSLTIRPETPGDADAYKGEADKFKKYFSPEPGKGE